MTELSENALAVAKKRYLKDGENWDIASERIGYSIASCEEDKEKWGRIFAEDVKNMYFLPGGRIMRNAGQIKQSMLNCACLPISDSIEEIGETIKNALILWSYGAGIGIDFSPLREKGSKLISKGGRSSGMVSFLRAINEVAKTIETGGQRRSGALAMCSVYHPEIYDFIDAKLKDGELSYFNLSVSVDNRFLNAVEEDKDWDLSFAGRKIRTVKAKNLWDKILDSMIKSGDPGLINYDNLVKNNSFYFQKIECTNLCSEIPLPGWGACCLGNLVLPKFISNRNTNWIKLEETVQHLVRFLDNVLDVNFYPIKQMELVTKDSRRIGLGYTGLHDYLMVKQIRYGSERSLIEIEKLFKFVRDVAYNASIDLAIEKGTFPKYSRTEFSNTSFVRKLPAKIRMRIKDNGIRNVCLLAAPPVGTASLVADVSSGIEPVFSLSTIRKDRVSERLYIHSLYKSFIESGEKDKPDWLVDVSDLSPIDHLEVQSMISKYLDNSISKTINCPKGTTTKDLSRLLLEYIRDLKGITVYVDGSKGNQILNKLSIPEIKKYLKNENITTDVKEEDVQCVRGTCEI